MTDDGGDGADYLCLAGPTASGKTAAALAIAEALAPRRAVEIVSVDSALVYRGMDIGTAKPSAAERAAVPHHLIDIVDPAERYSAARFVADAHAADRRDPRARPPAAAGRRHDAVLQGAVRRPRRDARGRRRGARRARRRRPRRDGWPALHAELARVDPATAARLAPNDSQRIQRALEVCRLSGRPLSALARPRRATGPAPRCR